MTINANDDYEKLAKLLYPSIEASGNVYYGQTKKLLMDEVLGKNDLGFESHIETLNVNTTYISYFVWRLGPLNGSVKIEPLHKDAPYVIENTFPDSGSIEFISKNNAVEESSWLCDSNEEPLYRCWRASSFFAKYRIKLTDEQNDNIINSGNFKTFYKSASAEYLGIVCTRDYSPIDGSTDDFINRNFYIDITEDSPILYVKLINHEVINVVEQQSEIEKPLTFTYIQAGSSVYHSIMLTQKGNHTGEYQIRKNDGQWENCQIDTWYEFEDPNDSYSFRRKPGTSFYTQNANDYIQFVTSGSYILASGNVMSLLDYEFSGITDLSYSFYGYCFYRLFKGCMNLLTAPILPATSLGDHCYCEMFSGCTSLFRSPELKASLTANKCYEEMFYGCESLSEVSLTNVNFYSVGDFEGWLDQTYGGDIITNDSSLVRTLKASGQLPETWFDAKRDPLTIIRIDNDSTAAGDIALVYGTLPTTNCKYKTNTMPDFASYNGAGIGLSTFGLGPSYVQFKDTRDFPIDEESFIYFLNDHDGYATYSQYKVCGNIASLLSENFENTSDLSNYQNAFIKLFANLSGLAKPPVLSNFSVLSNQCYYELLKSTSITYAPELPSTELANFCYYGMFRDCPYLINIPKLPATTLSDGCYAEMFEDCTILHGDVMLPAEYLTAECYNGMFYNCLNINKVIIGAKDTSAEYCLSGWLYGTTSEGNIYSSYTSLNFNSSSGIPSGWIDVCSKFELGITNNVLTQDYPDSSHYNYLVTSGCDSEENGRGIIDRSTRFNMLEEEPFRNGLTTPNEYNKKDGAYSQEIWGYKSFNSPVSFKNGIYGECSYLTTVPKNEMPAGADVSPYLYSYRGSILRCKNSFVDSKYESTLKIEYNSVDQMSTASLKANYKYYSDDTDVFSEIALNAKDAESNISIKSDNSENVAEISLRSDSSKSSITLSADEVNISKLVGELPSADFNTSNNELSVPVGGLICAYDAAGNKFTTLGAEGTIAANQNIPVGTFNTKYMYNGSEVHIPTGKYKVIIPSSTNGTCALLMRTL